MFEGFQIQDVVLPDVTLRERTGGLGSPHALPLLLLHGHPQSHTMWRRVAPVLAGHFHLVLADLRGCGDSTRQIGRAHV